MLVHFEHRERTRGHVRSDAPVGAHLRVIAHTAQEPVGNARCATGSPRDLPRGIGVNPHLQDARGADDDLEDVVLGVEIEAMDDAEARAQG